MGKKSTPNHLHRYKKINIGNGKSGRDFIVFKCMRPACTHYIPVHLSEGKLCECNRCNEPMLLTKAAMQLTKPHCINCVKRTKKADEVAKIAEFLSEVKL